MSKAPSALPQRPAVRVGNEIIFLDGAGRRLALKERIALRFGSLKRVERYDARSKAIGAPRL